MSRYARRVDGADGNGNRGRRRVELKEPEHPGVGLRSVSSLATEVGGLGGHATSGFSPGVTIRSPRIGPVLAIDLRYVRAAIHGLDLGGFRFGTGIRYPF